MVIRTRLPESAIRLPQAVPLKPPNTSEWMTPSRAQASMVTGSSATMGMCSVTRSPALQAGEVAQQRGELVHLPVQLRVADVHGLFGLEFGHEYDRGLVRIGRRVPVDAIVRGVQPAADEPLIERRGAGVQRRVPGLVPGQQVGVLLEAVRELVLGEPVQNGRVRRVGLLDETGGRRIDSSSRQCTAICAPEDSEDSDASRPALELLRPLGVPPLARTVGFKRRSSPNFNASGPYPLRTNVPLWRDEAQA